MTKNIKNIILSVFFLTTLVSCKAAQNSSDTKVNLSEGPTLIKASLEKDNVFKTPNFEYTTAYDSQINESNIKGLFLDGLDYKGKKTKVFCWYGTPANVEEGKKYPAVVLAHGGGGTAFHQWVKKWNDKGYFAIAIALEGQAPGERTKDAKGRPQHPTHEFSGPQRQGFFLDVVKEDLQNQWFYHAVADIIMANSFLRNQPNIDTDKIGITGISWGGILTNVTTGIDDRFAFAVPVYGCGFLPETPLYSKQLGYLSAKQRDFYLTHWEPSLYIPNHKQPTLFVNGTNDLHFTMNSFTKSYKASNAEKYVYVEHNMRHGHYPGWQPGAIYDFANYIINNDKKPITASLTNKTSTNQLIFNTKGNVTKSHLYYTTNYADWGKESYKWIEKEAEVNSANNQVQVQLPENAVAYFINITDKDGVSYSTPMEIINK